MSKIIASAAIRGAHGLVAQAEEKLAQAIEAKGQDHAVGFPNTGYYLPIIYAILGTKVEKLSDLQPVLAECRTLLPPLVDDEIFPQNRQIHRFFYLLYIFELALKIFFIGNNAYRVSTAILIRPRNLDRIEILPDNPS